MRMKEGHHSKPSCSLPWKRVRDDMREKTAGSEEREPDRRGSERRQTESLTDLTVCVESIPQLRVARHRALRSHHAPLCRSAKDERSRCQEEYQGEEEEEEEEEEEMNGRGPKEEGRGACEGKSGEPGEGNPLENEEEEDEDVDKDDEEEEEEDEEEDGEDETVPEIDRAVVISPFSFFLPSSSFVFRSPQSLFSRFLFRFLLRCFSFTFFFLFSFFLCFLCLSFFFFYVRKTCACHDDISAVKIANGAEGGIAFGEK